jgi:hypothetical protein
MMLILPDSPADPVGNFSRNPKSPTRTQTENLIARGPGSGPQTETAESKPDISQGANRGVETDNNTNTDGDTQRAKRGPMRRRRIRTKREHHKAHCHGMKANTGKRTVMTNQQETME